MPLLITEQPPVQTLPNSKIQKGKMEREQRLKKCKEDIDELTKDIHSSLQSHAIKLTNDLFHILKVCSITLPLYVCVCVCVYV